MNKLQKIMSKIYRTVICASVGLQMACMNAVTAWCDQQTLEVKEITEGTGATNVIGKLAGLYQKWGILLIFVSALEFFISKDERKKGMAKTVLIGAVVAYVLCMIAGVDGKGFASLVNTVMSWFGGTATS